MSAWGNSWGVSWGSSWGAVQAEQPSGGWEDHPYLKPVRHIEEERESTQEVVSPVIEVKVDRRRKPKKERPKERDQRLEAATQYFREHFRETYIHEAVSDMTEAEIRRKRRNAAITLLLLH